MMLTATGCDPGVLSGILGDGLTLRGSDGDVVDEPNDEFAFAQVLTLNAFRETSVSSAISPVGDVDLYDIGPVSPGDRIVVDVTTARNGRSGLDARFAMFDDRFRLIAWNDDRDFESGALDPRVDLIVRHESDRCYLGVSAVRGTGAYAMSVAYTPGRFAPDPRAQTVLLDFDGGQVTLPSQGLHVVGAFDAADIDPDLAGETERMKAVILATVAENFDGLDLRVRNTDDDVEPVSGTFSRVLFGGFSSQSFGASQAVDVYNAVDDDDSIIYTEVFTPEIFLAATESRAPHRAIADVAAPPCFPARIRLQRLILGFGSTGTVTVDDIARAIGNVASHEIGHLLGLSHVADPDFIMDTIGASITLVRDQEFGEAPLDESIFPVGVQDSHLLLTETVGTTE